MLRLLVLLCPLPLLACLAHDLPGEARGSPPACPARFVEQAPGVLARGGVLAASTFFPDGEAEAQERRYPGKVCPAQALALAVQALLTSTQRESLLEVSETIGLPDCGARCYFDRESSLLGIVADERSNLSSRFLPLPPAARSVSEHWVFFLSVPDLDEHGYWVLVSRDGSGVETFARN